jgi:hypothetical protein
MGFKELMETTTAAMEKPVSGRKAQSSTSAFPVALLQRKCACGGTATSAPQGECEECRKKKLQRRAADFRKMAGVPPIVEEVLDSSGQALDFATREFMEPRFGHDFSRVRVHTDHKASQSAKAVNALAYTVGHNVVFAGGQYAPGKKSGQKLLAHELTHVVQQRKMASVAPQSKLEIGPANDSMEQEADRFAEKLAGVSATATATPPTPPAESSNGPRSLLQRAPADQAPATTAPALSAPGLIVDDEVQELADGQMHKTEFLDKLHAEVCVTSDAALAPVGRTSQGCPFIEKWIARLRGRSGQHIEKAIRKYAPESAGATRAADYIAPVGAKVQRGVSRWAATGEITGVPPELMAEVAGGGILDAIGSAFSGIISGIGGAISGVGHLFTKANDGGARTGNPLAIQSRLHSESNSMPLESGVRARMESAFGHSFGDVRVHDGSRAAHLSSSLNARAFTVGRDVAFAAGEYQPGTLFGDALIAHELAHVIQQNHGESGVMTKGSAEYNTLEEDADMSAVSAMVSLWSGARGSLKAIGKNAMPRLRSGLRLQRCGASKPAIKAEQTNVKWDSDSGCSATLQSQINDLLGLAIATVRTALTALASPKNVEEQLMKNFKLTPESAGIEQVRQVLQGVIEAMEATGSGNPSTVSLGTAPRFICVPCARETFGGTTNACAESPAALVIGLCVQDDKISSPNPLRTVIHEFIHASCGRTKAVVGDPKYLQQGTGVTIAGEPGERKYQETQNDASENLKSAYAYAQFVMDVTH